VAAVMTYTSLIDDMKRYLERGEPGDTAVIEQLPRLVALAEKNIAAELKPDGFEQWIVSSAPLNAGTFTVQKPVRWRKTISMAYLLAPDYDRRYPILSRRKEYIETVYPSVASADRGYPVFYSDYGPFHWLVMPAFIVALKLATGYYEEIQPLDDANQTNWLTQYAPQVLLYRALLESQPFLKNDPRIETWKKMYSDAAAAMMREDFSKPADRAETVESR